MQNVRAVLAVLTSRELELVYAVGGALAGWALITSLVPTPCIAVRASSHQEQE